MDPLGIIYLAFTLLVVLIGFSMLPGFGTGITLNIALFMLSATAILILALNWADFIIFPGFTSLLNITFQPARDYTITKKQDAVLKNVAGLYYATGYISANLFPYIFKMEVAEQESEIKALQAADTWEKIVMSLNIPFKFHVLSSGLDVQGFRDELEGARGYQEFQLARAYESKANETTITELQRKISIIQARIDKISQGEKPIATIMYLETTAVAVSEKAAIDILNAQINQLSVAFGSFDVQLNRIAGRELYTLFKFNFSLPSTYEKMTTYFQLEG